MAKLRPQIPYFVGHPAQRVLGAIMMRRAITLVLSCAALSAVARFQHADFSLPSFTMPSFSVTVRRRARRCMSHRFRREPRQASAGRSKLHHALHVDRNEWHGDYNVNFTLKGYRPQSVPVRIAVNESSSMQSGDAGVAPTTVITPDPVTAELAAMKSTAARTKPKAATTTAATSAPPPPASSPPPPASPTMPSALATTER